MNFGHSFDESPVTITPSGSSSAGQTYMLMCSVSLIEPIPLPFNVPLPTFEWFYGANGNASLPSGVTSTLTLLSRSNSNNQTYTSYLQFSRVSQSHSGNYTCRLGPGRLFNTAMVTVNGKI